MTDDHGKPEVRIDNVVCTFSLGIKSISLKNLYCACPAFEYNAAHFGAAVINVERPKCTCLIFSSASGVCVGAQSQEAAHLGLTVVVNTIKMHGFKEVHIKNFKVRNIVSSIHLQKKIDLPKLAVFLNASCSYNPLLFPGLRCKPVAGHSSSALIYSTGSIVITGCVTVSECVTIAQRVYDLCLKCDTDKPLDARSTKKQRLVNEKATNIPVDDETVNLPNVSCISRSEDVNKVGLSMCIFNECDAWTADPDLNEIFSSTPSDADVAFMSAKATGIAALKQEVKHRKKIVKKARGAHKLR